MKTVLLLAMFVASTALSVAQQPVPAKGNTIPMSITPADLVRQPDGKEGDAAQGVIFKLVTRLELLGSQYHAWPFGPVSNDMFVYDAKSNTLNIARNKVLFTGNSLTGTEIGVLRSTDNGSTWNLDVIQKINNLFGMPVMGWVNPDESSDASKFPISIYGITYAMPAGTYLGTGLWNRTSAGPYELKSSDQPEPASGNEVSLGDLYADNSSGAVHFASTLNADPGVPDGAYGYFNVNLIVDDYGQLPTIPSAWALDKWRPSPEAGSFNAPMFIEGDGTGTLYAGFNNITAADGAVRSVQVSKSTDEGKTWGAYNEMPMNLITEFATAHGGDIGFQSGQTPYRGGEFLVVGKDEYSFFYPLATGILSPTNPDRIDSVVALHIVEASYKAGTWSLAEVGELQTFEISTYSVIDSISTAIGAPAITVEDFGRGHEIQAAKTKDGNTLVIKYIDINIQRPVNEFPAIRVFDRQTNGSYVETDPLTQVIDTDIFIATRPKNSTQWGDPVNASDDTDMEFRTYMPRVVAGVNDIPLLRILGLPTNGVPVSVTQMSYTRGAAIDYANTGVVSVEDEKFYSFRFGNIAPNPVFSTAEVSFTLDRAASVSIEVYNMLGTQLSSVAPQSMASGIHGVNVDASTLAAGAYNVALVVDGVRIMKPFIVVR